MQSVWMNHRQKRKNEKRKTMLGRLSLYLRSSTTSPPQRGNTSLAAPVSSPFPPILYLFLPSLEQVLPRPPLSPSLIT